MICVIFVAHFECPQKSILIKGLLHRAKCKFIDNNCSDIKKPLEEIQMDSLWFWHCESHKFGGQLWLSIKIKQLHCNGNHQVIQIECNECTKKNVAVE